MINSDKIIDGKKLAAQHERLLAAKIKKLKTKPKVVSILVGEDPASVLYSQMKQKKAQELGISFALKSFPENAHFDEIAEEIKKLNKDRQVSGIMVQLPLPKKFLGENQPEDLLRLINPKKDVDGLTGKGKSLPAAVKAVLSILDDEKIKVSGADVTIIGASQLVGLPLAKQLEKKRAKVSVCDINTSNLREQTLRADILISAAGEPDLVIGKMVKDGAVVIDVGISKIDGKIAGDVDFESVSEKASKITPVPGGVGPMTIISLMENVTEAFMRKLKST